MPVSFCFFPLPQAVSLCWFGLISVSTRHHSLPGRSLSLSLSLSFSFSLFLSLLSPSAHSGQSHFLFISILLSSSPSLRLSLPLVLSPSRPSRWLRPLRTLPPSMSYCLSGAVFHSVLSVLSSVPLSWKTDNTIRSRHTWTSVNWAYWKSQEFTENVNQSTDLMNL